MFNLSFDVRYPLSFSAFFLIIHVLINIHEYTNKIVCIWNCPAKQMAMEIMHDLNKS